MSHLLQGHRELLQSPAASYLPTPCSVFMFCNGWPPVTLDPPLCLPMPSCSSRKSSRSNHFYFWQSRWHRIASGELWLSEVPKRNLRPESPTENGLILSIFPLGVGSHYCAKVVIVNLLLIHHDEFPPSFLASFALHLVFVDCGSRIEFGEVFLQMLIYVVIHLGESQRRPADLFEDCPICRHMLNGCGGVSWRGILKAEGRTANLSRRIASQSVDGQQTVR
jgi:hypothetical protein